MTFWKPGAGVLSKPAQASGPGAGREVAGAFPEQTPRDLEETVLIIEDLCVAYGPAAALTGVNLRLKAGEIMGLVGPNGSGKSTLIRAATRLAPVRHGGISVRGQDVTALSQNNLAKLVAVVPQNPILPGNFAAFDVVMMGRTPYLGLLQAETEADYQAVRSAMLATDSWQFANRPLGELSGGERQRIVIARSLAQETPLLLLDEPTSHLDLGHQASFFQLLHTICRLRSVAALIALHDLTIASLYCHRLALLDKGRLAATGHPHEVLNRDLLAQVYQAPVAVFRHPESGRPVVTPAQSGFEGLPAAGFADQEGGP